LKPNTVARVVGLGVCVILATSRLAYAHHPAEQVQPPSVAMSGDTVVLGVPSTDDGRGLSHVYVRDGAAWIPQATLTDPDGAAGDSFGHAVSIDGDTIVVGAPCASEYGYCAGAAHVFARSGQTWTREAILTAPEAAEQDFFGWSVAIHGDTALIGAVRQDGWERGGAHVFRRAAGSWAHQATLTPEGAPAPKFSGHSVALYEDTALLGALGDESDNAGAAYVFVRTGDEWSQDATLTAPGAKERDYFGRTVALDGDTALIGAHPSGKSDYVGFAHVFRRGTDGWVHEGKLSAGTDGDAFALSVALDGDTALIGAPYDDDRGPESGALHVFTRSNGTWIHENKLTHPDGWQLRALGHAVTMDEGFGVAVSSQDVHFLDGTIFNNGPPEPRHDDYVALEDEALIVEAPGVLANDVDPEGDPMSVILGDPPLHGSVDLRADGSFTYVPDTDFSGVDGFGYVMCAGWGCNTALVTIDVAPVNDAPVAQNVTAFTDEDRSIGLVLSAADVDSRGLTYEIVSSPERGSVAWTDPIALYTPGTDFYGVDAFTFRAGDGESWSDPATVTIVVRSVNDVPIAHDGHAVTHDNVPVAITLGGSDVEGDPLSFDIVGGPAHGTLSGTEPDLVYTPHPWFYGADAFTFRAWDGEAWSEPASLSIDVWLVNEPPTANDDAAWTAQYQPITVAVLSNDGDPDGDPMQITAVGRPLHGSITMNRDGTITYLPDSTFKDSDEFVYTVADPYGATATATVRITEVGCGEEGAQSLEGTPAEGAASETVDREVEPLAGSIDPSLARAIHEANCSYVVELEDELDDR